MSSEIKQLALKDTVKLAQVAFGTAGDSAVTPFMRSSSCVEFLDDVYHKLCELYEDALAK